MKYLDFLNGSRSATNVVATGKSAAMRKNNGGNTAVYRKIAGAAVIGCLGGLAAYHATLNPQPEKGLSDVNLANIEALAQESGSSSCTVTYNCGDGIISCTGTTCSRKVGYVTCNGVTTSCYDHW